MPKRTGYIYQVMELLRLTKQIGCVSIFWLVHVPCTWGFVVALVFSYLQSLTDAIIALGLAVFAAIPITGGVVIAELFVWEWWRTVRNKKYELPL